MGGDAVRSSFSTKQNVTRDTSNEADDSDHDDPPRSAYSNRGSENSTGSTACTSNNFVAFFSKEITFGRQKNLAPESRIKPLI